ncbi:MAG: hypothetical protein Fur006_25610 [Coleofasciculaceae cyanobacterium]
MQPKFTQKLMPLTELVPILKELSYSDKLLLLHFLVAELLKESDLVPLDVQGKVASQGLHDSFEAAAVLAKALAEEKVATHG